MNDSEIDSAVVRTLDTSTADFQTHFSRLKNRDAETVADVSSVVAEIIASIRSHGDASLIEYTQKFDRLTVAHASELELDSDRLEQAEASLAQPLRQALIDAQARIRSFHERQSQDSWEYQEADGTVLGQRVAAVERAGIYVPGGQASYPSSVLMTAIAASVAGVEEIIMVVPAPDGVINEAVLAAARIAGVNRVFRVGGAQAIAALAYGTETIPPVDKIVGPGNVYVAEAKRQVFGKVGIDMIAGPSEILIIADREADPEWITMDLFAQAEHDELAQSILVTDSSELISRVKACIEQQLPAMARSGIIAASLRDYGAMIKVRNMEEALTISNSLAPEHLEIMTADARKLADGVHNAGAIFIGRHSAEVLGDYCAGPSHVLPTAGTARFSSPLGVYDFQKRTSIISASPDGADAMARTAALLAQSESLEAHARSARLRISDSSD